MHYLALLNCGTSVNTNPLMNKRNKSRPQPSSWVTAHCRLLSSYVYKPFNLISTLCPVSFFCIHLSLGVQPVTVLLRLLCAFPILPISVFVPLLSILVYLQFWFVLIHFCASYFLEIIGELIRPSVSSALDRNLSGYVCCMLTKCLLSKIYASFYSIFMIFI